jgi:hypothetical protein
MIYFSAFSCMISNGILTSAMYFLYFEKASGDNRAVTVSFVVFTRVHKSN